MTIGRLRGVLDAIGLSVSARELTEILWLACQLTAEQAELDGQLGDDHSGYQQPGHPDAQEGPVETASQSQTEAGTAQASKAGGEIAAHGLYAHATADGRSFAVGSVDVPTAPMLHDTLAVQRALRPLKRKVASHRAGELDEDATARRIAEQPNRQRWVPIMRPAPERWLSLALVVDTGPSMWIWRSLARELEEALTSLGAFRDLRIWYLKAGKVATTRGGPPLNAAGLLDASGRQACLVFSDCSGGHWWNGAALQALHLWGQNSPTAILQPLAERLWCRTAVPPIPGLAHSRRAVAPNIELSFTPHEASSERGLPVPVLEISPLWLADWTRLIVGPSGAPLPMAVAYLSGRRITRPEPLQREGDLPITERVQRFLAAASPGAARLAAHVAVSVPTLPVIRLIHHQLVPNPEPGHIAEVLLSGLLRPVEGELDRYEFVPGARQALLATLPRSESWNAAYILSRISAEIENRVGRVGEVFRAYLQVQHGVGEQALVSNRPFALVSLEALRYLRFDPATLLSSRGQQSFQQADQLDDLHDSTLSAAASADSRQTADKAPDDRIDMEDSGPESSPVPRDSPLGEDLRSAILESRSRSEPPAKSSAATPTVSRRLGRGTPIHCPYCYSRFTARDIQFRCSARSGSHNTGCNSVIDEVLLIRTGFAETLPPVFSADGRSVKAQCPYCNNETAIRVCPVCHSALPAHFGLVKSRMIALVGAKESGKTVFMTVLLHELMYRVGERFGAAVSAADETTLHRFSREYEPMLYREAQLLPATQPASLSRIEPIVFRITTQERRLLGTTRTQRTMLSFYDAAGQDFSSMYGLEMNIRYLSAADGIILLLDPLQMPGVRHLVGPRTRLPMTGGAADDPADVFSRVTELLLSQNDPSKRIKKPVAIVFTKIDALWHDLKGNSPLLRPAPAEPFFNETDSQEVHSEVLRLLNLWHGRQIDQIANRNYQRHRYFALSALGNSPTDDNRVSPAGIRPYRVADPFLWLLAEFGVIRRS